MKRRRWGANSKAMIVIEGLKGQPVAAMCPAQQIRQSLYYQWRDQLLSHAATAFEAPQRTRTEARLAQENARLKPLVGELTVAFTKSDALLA